MALLNYSCGPDQAQTVIDPPTDRSVHFSTSSQLRKSIISDARQQLGSRYQYGGRGPDRYDCSGLVHYVYGLHDINIDGSSQHMSQQARSIPLSQALPGDLIFFDRKGEVFHVAIITSIDDEELWVAHSTSSKGVIREDIYRSPYWRPKIYKVISLAALK